MLDLPALKVIPHLSQLAVTTQLASLPPMVGVSTGMKKATIARSAGECMTRRIVMIRESNPTTTKPSIDKATPEQIWLQWYGDADPDLEVGEVSVEDVTWEREQIFKHDVAYVRQDIADERVREARREVWEHAVSVARISAKKSLKAGLNIASLEIAIRRLEIAARAAEGGEGE